ncbi:hypothetical protein APY94_00210 [Thermococcus celericrescens]|uniref:DUF1156 domain-containing protein n=1 Tax=Thermococcus celericrescens TaxID=227598 RepID=A0A100XZX6_9EURY|nr:DUF1156 domain-containing protein [Thermococcus celericrescens]KUH34832.1 hypothetical protein APY94_00210 [Thermococcus celericrescens]
MERRFIESPRFPIWEVNLKSSKEKGPARPPYWEMVFYWTRKPLIGARAVIAGALLPEDIDENRFKTMIGLNENTPHRVNPKIPPEWEKYFRGKKLLDPFAGFGSIPLEGLRLGLDVTAVELLPTTYVFLKAVLDYPKKFGKPLVKDVERWGNWITEQLKNDPEIRELYDEDVAVYIGTWEVKCPHCGRWTPAIGNYWLARVKDGKGYKRLAYMKPERNGDEVEIRVVDLNEILGDVSKAKVDTKAGEITFEGEAYVRKVEEAIRAGRLKEDDVRISGNRVVFRVPEANISNQQKQLRCLLCGNAIKYADENGRHYTERKKGMPNEFYVKFALRKYHEGDERFTRQRLLVKVKVKGRDLIFEPATKEDNEKLWKAKEKVREMLERRDPDVPTEKMQPYGGATLGDIYKVFISWNNLFNPRQLLTLIKIVRLIREAGKKVEEEKLKEGWDEERAFEYAEAVATYLSIGLGRYADYTNVCTLVDAGNPWGIKLSHTLSNRGISMQFTWGDNSPISRVTRISGIIQDTYTLTKAITNVVRALDYLTSALAPSTQKTLTDFTGNSIKVLQGDATSLNLGEKFDVIVTDPPYADDVAYTELSDFYYVWLKRALSDSDERKLIPRFHRTAFFKKIGPKWVEIKAQWQEFAKKEISMYPARFGNKSGKEAKEIAQQHFENLFSQAFVAMMEHLKDDGLLVTYYAHTDPESWANLIEAGWRRAKLQITRAIPVNTESATSIVSRGKLSLDTSIVAVWRKTGGERKQVQISVLRGEMEWKAKDSAREFIKYGYAGLDLLYGVMAAVLEEVTKYGEVLSPKGPIPTKELLNDYVYPATIRGIIEAIAEIEEGQTVTSNEAVFYTAYKVLFGNKSLKPNDIILLNLATFTDSNGLIKEGVLKQKGSASKKEFTLYSVDLLGKKALDAKEFQKFLYEKGINPLEPEPRNAIDVLQLLEYYALLGKSRLEEVIEKLRRKWSAEVEEALAIARLVSEYYTAVYGQLLAPLGGKIKADERTIEKELEKDGHFEVLLMRRLVRSIGGEGL